MTSINWASLIQALTQIVAGGIPSWIAAGIFGLLGFIGYFLFKGWLNSAAGKESQQEQDTGEANNVVTGNNAEQNNDNAQTDINATPVDPNKKPDPIKPTGN